jgi:hypothetical protein
MEINIITTTITDKVKEMLEIIIMVSNKIEDTMTKTLVHPIIPTEINSINNKINLRLILILKIFLLFLNKVLRVKRRRKKYFYFLIKNLFLKKKKIFFSN